MNEKQRLDLPRLKLGWDEGRTERLLASVHVRLGRRKRAWRAAALSATFAVVCVALVAFRGGRVPAVTSSSNDARPQVVSRSPIHLGDGSEIEFDPATSDIRVIEERASLVRVDVVRGTSRYAVVSNPDRTFEVRSGSVTITVIGTEFVVQRHAETTWVEV
jgi:transmembrane sensor